MGSVSLGIVSQIFRHADIDGNGKLDRPEIAKEALAAFGSGDSAVGGLLATFVQGGVQGNGLFPDANQDGQLSFEEMVQFARLGGDPNGITPEDFRAGFGSQAMAQGQGIDMQKLSTLASQNTDKFNADLDNPTGFANGLNFLGAGEGTGINTQSLMMLVFALILGKK